MLAKEISNPWKGRTVRLWGSIWYMFWSLF